MMRWWSSLTVVVLLLCGSWAPGASPQAARDELQQAYPGVNFYWEGSQLARVYGTPFGFGVSPEQSADDFVRTYSQALGVTADELVPGNSFNNLYTQPVMYDQDTGTYKFTMAYYTHYRDGLRVFGSELRLLMLNDPAGYYPLVWAGSSLRDLGEFQVPAVLPPIAEGAAHAAAIAQIPGLINFTDSELGIWLGRADGEPEADAGPHVAITFIADNGLPATGEYQKWRFVADAATGKILEKESQIIYVDVVGNVSGLASPDYRADACITEIVMPMPYARVSIGSTVAFADINGDFVIPNAGTTQVTVTSEVRGRWFDVNNKAGSDSVLNQNVVPPGPANFLHNPSNSEYTTAEVNGYIQANTVRDMALGANPSYPVIYNQQDWPVNVNINSTCNAYYDYSSINFYRAGGGCNNTAFGDVVHHEYGHHLVSSGGSGQDAYGEGMGDTMGLLITGRSQTAIGFESCTTGIRDANNTIQYPCSGEIHYCGQLLSGCVWNTREQLKITEPLLYNTIIRKLAINSILMHTGGGIAPSITIDFLTLDDTDGDISNGTPHYNEIAAGFGSHNMPAPPLSLLSFSFPNGRPEMVSPAGGTTIRVEVKPLNEQPQPGTGRLYYNTGGGWVNQLMTVVAPNVYDAVFPAITCGTTVRYYFSAQTTTGQTVYNPADAPATTYSALAAYGLVVVFQDDFNTNLGWTVENSTGLTSGAWERGIPVNCGRGDPPTDYDGSGYCYLTDNRNISGCDTDVDGGYTWLKSPTLDLSAGDAKITYALWYTNNYGNDPNNDLFKTYVSNDNGTNWVVAEVVGPVTTEGWFLHSFNVGAFVTPNATVKVRYEASDLNAGSVVEAGVDAFRVERVVCTPPYKVGDLNCDGTVDFGDINPFVLALADPAAYAAQYPGCPFENRDINGDGQFNFGDINPFVALLTGP